MAQMHRAAATPVTISRGPLRSAFAPWLLGGGAGMAMGVLLTLLVHSPDAGSASATQTRAEAGSAWFKKTVGMDAADCGAARDNSLSATAATPPDSTLPASASRLLDQVLHAGELASRSPISDASAAEQLMSQARQSMSLRQSLLARYTTEQDPSARSRLAAVLIGTGSPDIARFAAGMLSNPDPAQRQHGLEILASMPDDPQARQALRNALGAENDPATLGMVLQALTPGDARAPQDVQAMTDTLQPFTRRPEPVVRAAALQALAQWGGATAEASLMGGLADQDETVVETAIEALGEMGAGRSATANDALLNLAERPDASPELRQSAIATLSDTNLDRARYERLQRLRQQSGLSS